jgi:hypothetical protein
VFLYGGDGRQVERTFTCGSQREAVRAWYRPAEGRPPGTADGTLISLVFEAH